MSEAADTSSFRASGIITLTTDFGTGDPFVGVMKGQVLRRFARASLVDLTHAVSVHRPAEAGFWLGRAYRYFPPGTVHLAVVDPGVGSSRQIAVVEGDGHLFLAPDNGLLAGVLERLVTPPVVRVLSLGVLDDLALGPPSHTFHGRDIFAPVAAEVAAGRLRPERLGAVEACLVPGSLAAPQCRGDQVAGVVVTIDHFGNLLTNLGAELLAGIRDPEIQVAGLKLALRRTYSDVAPGDYVALVNSFGVLEIARAGMSASAGLSLERGAEVLVGSAGR